LVFAHSWLLCREPCNSWHNGADTAGHGHLAVQQGRIVWSCGMVQKHVLGIGIRCLQVACHGLYTSGPSAPIEGHRRWCCSRPQCCAAYMKHCVKERRGSMCGACQHVHHLAMEIGCGACLSRLAYRIMHGHSCITHQQVCAQETVSAGTRVHTTVGRTPDLPWVPSGRL